MKFVFFIINTNYTFYSFFELYVEYCLFFPHITHNINVQHLRDREEERGEAARARGQREGGSQTGEGRGEGEEEERVQRTDGGLSCQGRTEEEE